MFKKSADKRVFEVRAGRRFLTLGGLRKAVVDGDVIHGSVMAGQIAGLVKDSRSCKEIIEGICREMKNVVLSQAENIGR